MLRWGRKYGRVIDSDFFSGLRFVTTRGEHRVYQDVARYLAIKETHPGQFGYSVRAEGVGATPLEYLERLAWQNHIFGDDIRIIGVYGENRVIRIVTSQPWITEPERAPPPTEREIAEY